MKFILTFALLHWCIPSHFRLHTRAKRPDGDPLPHCARQVGAPWHLPSHPHGYLAGHRYQAPTRFPALPEGGARDMGKESAPSHHLGCCDPGCGVSGGGTTGEETTRKVLMLQRRGVGK